MGGRLSVPNSPSGRYWEREQTTAMGYPADVVELCPIPGMAAPDFLAARLAYKIAGHALRARPA